LNKARFNTHFKSNKFKFSLKYKSYDIYSSIISNKENDLTFILENLRSFQFKNAEKVINRIKYCIEIDKYSIEYKEE